MARSIWFRIEASYAKENRDGDDHAEQVLKLAQQLPLDDQKSLIEQLRQKANERALTFEERKSLFKALQIESPVTGDFSLNREDWYDDDGR